MREPKRNAPSLASLFLFFFLLAFLTLADDASVMKELSKAISPPPPGWSAPNPCDWLRVVCDSSKRVTVINLSSKSLSGTLSPHLNQLTQLERLSLQGNTFSGPLPSFANLNKLSELHLDHNNFTSIPPNCFSGLTNLKTLTLNENPSMERWVFPADLAQSGNLVELDARKVNLMGSLPDIFQKLISLQTLRLSYNNLTGTLPISLGGTGVQNLQLNDQLSGLSGGIDVLGKMHQISQVWLHKNKFSGPIPDLSKCNSLSDLKLNDNQLTGVVPPSLTLHPQLRNVSLSNNKLQGPYPEFGKDVTANLGTTNNFCNTEPGPCDPQVTTLLNIVGDMGYPMNLAKSWTGNDACKEWTFVTCDAQKKTVIIINFSKQHFGGKISPAYGELTSLSKLVLNDNDLNGAIPDSLTRLSKLELLDVSNNNLTGKVPVFPPTVKLITTGNKMLGKDINTSEGGSTNSGSTQNFPRGAIIAVIVTVIVISIVVCAVLYRRHASKHPLKFWPMENKITPNSSGVVCKDGHRKVEKESINQKDKNIDPRSFQGGNAAMPFQVLRQVTNNFSKDNILGEGGFGTVYKGVLHDGTQIAVKRMESAGMSKKGLKEFDAEIAVLSKVRHRNLVGLLGFCTNDRERLLVYEYMPQGTLGDNLFEWREKGKNPLTWNQRIAIALDVARGVEYLHTLASESFIHRDLKASNILLGDDMRAKVSDFGLVKTVAPGGKRSVETKLAGTFGYLAPEYASTGKVSTKVDVFAFGAVLMEMITGRKALDEERPEEDSHLVTWFRKIMVNKDALRSSVDPMLEPADEAYGSISKVIQLAGHCTTKDANQRPDMSHAVNVLSPLVEHWTPSNNVEDDQQGIKLNISLSQALERWKANEGSSGVDDWWPEGL